MGSFVRGKCSHQRLDNRIQRLLNRRHLRRECRRCRPQTHLSVMGACASRPGLGAQTEVSYRQRPSPSRPRRLGSHAPRRLGGNRPRKRGYGSAESQDPAGPPYGMKMPRHHRECFLRPAPSPLLGSHLTCLRPGWCGRFSCWNPRRKGRDFITRAPQTMRPTRRSRYGHRVVMARRCAASPSQC